MQNDTKSKQAAPVPECITCTHVLDCKADVKEVKRCINYEERKTNKDERR